MSDTLTKLCATLDYHIARARLWKQTAKKWYRQALSWQAWGEAHRADADRRLELLKNCRGDLANARRSAWSWKKATDRRGELLRDIYNDKTYESMDISLAIRIEKELADAKK